MKKHLSMYITALTLLAALATPAGLVAQDDPDHKHWHHHYQLIDMGALGGSQSYLSSGSGLAFGQHVSVVNAEGTVAGYADTSNADLFQNYCFSSDCLATHTFLSDGSGILTDLGALRGGGDSAPNWITANGLIAGVSENGETDPLYPGLPQLRAVLWKNGKIVDLGTLPEGGDQSEANSVNSSGQVVGAALNTVPDNNSMQVGTWWLWGGDGGISPPYFYQTRAFFWDKEHGMQDMGTLGGTDAQALLINERGQVVGLSYPGSTTSPYCPYPLVTDSFVWEKNTGMVDLGTLGGTCTLATDLNQKGQVVGESNLAGDRLSHAFFWSHGDIHDLGDSLGGSYSGAESVNENEEVAGFAYYPDNTTFHAVLWKEIGHMTNLGVIGDDQCSYSAAVNASEQVVGSSISSCTAEEPTFRAFLWEDGMMLNLNNLIPAGSPLSLQNVQTINDRGEIAGQGADSSGNNHAFLLIPCDENHPGVEGCDYSLVDTAAATRESPVPAVQESTTTAGRNLHPFGRRGVAFSPGQIETPNAQRSPSR
jgi:probable HAF family extracellular repeat protein